MEFNVLLVDDNRDLIESMALLMGEEKVRTHCAYNLEAARNLVNQQNFNLIYLDVRLPDGNGLSFLRELKLRNPNQQVMMMTGFRMEQVITDATQDRFQVLYHHDYTDDLARHLATMEDHQALLFMDRYDELHSLFHVLEQVNGYNVLHLDNFELLDSPAVADADLVLVESRESLMHAYSMLLGLRAVGCNRPACVYVDLPDIPDARRQRSADYLGCILKPFDPLQVLEDFYARFRLAAMNVNGEAVA